MTVFSAVAIDIQVRGSCERCKPEKIRDRDERKAFLLEFWNNRFNTGNIFGTGVYQTPQGYYAAEKRPDEFAAFDAGFPKKEKLVLPGQIF